MLEHIERGDKLAVNGAASFPMASVFKIPIFGDGIQASSGGAICADGSPLILMIGDDNHVALTITAHKTLIAT